MQTVEETKQPESVEERIEILAKEIEKAYNDRHFWKRGHIYADGFRNGAKCALIIVNHESQK